MGLNTDKLKEKAENAKKGNTLYFGLEEGKRNVVRVLPRSLKFFSKDGDNDFAFTYFVHYYVFDVDGYKRVVCKKSAGQKCPICDYAESFTDRKQAKKYMPSKIHLYNVLDYDSGQIKPFESGPFIYDEILKFVVDPAWGDSLFDTKTGRDIIIQKDIVPANKRGQVNPYSVAPVPDRSDVTELLPDNWDEVLDKLQDRIPDVEDDAFYLSIVEHYRNGTVPEPIKKDKDKDKDSSKESTQKAEPAKAAPAPAATAPKETEPVNPNPPEEKEEEQPKCFGLEYSPRLDKCKGCASKAECRDATLKL